jgi:PPK2 family polyphosphate:nucleotide phosphotransferase
MTDKRAKRIAEFIKPLRVKPGSKVNLAKDFDPGYKADFLKKKDGVGLLQTGIGLLADYQPRLAAQDTYGVLVCLQALDAGGKDGTIRHVMSGVNPQGVHVSGFKVPSAEELDHDYLWRYARRLPARGDIGIFNRSHYEEVLVVRVHPENLDRQKLPKEAKGKGVWERRYREINDWERYLADNGFKVVKLFLNLSKEEQRTRFFKRLDLPEKNWKFSAADVRERQRWDDYQKAFSEMLSATSTRWAPWYVIPADRKWFARICTAAVLAHTLMEIDPQYPEVTADRRQELLVVKGELETQAPKGAPADPFAAKAKAKAEAKAEAEGKTADGQSAVPARRASRGRDGAARAGQRAAAPRTPRARSEADGQGQPTRARPAAGGTPSPAPPAQAAPRTARARTTRTPATPSPAPPAQAAPRTTRARTTRTPATPSPASPAPASPRPRRPRPGSQQG